MLKVKNQPPEAYGQTQSLLLEHAGLMEYFYQNENMLCLALLDTYLAVNEVFPDDFFLTPDNARGSQNKNNIVMENIYTLMMEYRDDSLFMPGCEPHAEDCTCLTCNDAASKYALYLEMCYRVSEDMDLSMTTHRFIIDALHRHDTISADIACSDRIRIEASNRRIVRSHVPVVNGEVIPKLTYRAANHFR